MNNIYELLNDVQMNLDEYDDQKLSAFERKKIKKRILKEIKSMKDTHRKIRVSAVAGCALALIILSSIGLATATGVLPKALKNVFGIDSTEKVQVANNIGGELNISAEDNGYKVTAEAVLSDDKNISIVYRIEKADGGPLDQDGRICTDVDFWDFHSDTTWEHARVDNVEQEYNADYIEYYTSFSYTEHVKKKEKISLGDMRLWFENDENSVEISGDWEFNIPLDTKDSSVVDLAEGQEITIGKNKATVEELMFSPLGYSITVTSTEEMTDNDVIKSVDGKALLCLKNGKKIQLDGGSWVQDNEDGTWSFVVNGTYEKLILPEDMDKVVIGEYEFSF